MKTPAILALENGEIYRGTSIGAEGSSVGEVVFNTSITGYQEIISDPSYAQQIVTLTYPHIGNVGVNRDDVESSRIFAAGLVVRDVPARLSNWRAENSLTGYLIEQNVVGIAGLDTRKLTRTLREQGAQRGCLATGEAVDVNWAIEQARGFPGLKGMDLAKVVSAPSSYVWTQTEWRLDSGYGEARSSRFHVVAYDYGIKRNILRMLAARGCRLTVVPAQTPASEVLAMKPDGVFLSNGPGDPEPCDYAIAAIREIVAARLPVFGICLGHQLLALASGASTVKMKFGHHGGNHPVLELSTGRVMITSQNHGFAVDETSLPAHLRPTYRSLFDGTLQGVERTDCKAFSFQGHPEASPGPHDLAPLFDRFVGMMER